MKGWVQLFTSHVQLQASFQLSLNLAEILHLAKNWTLNICQTFPSDLCFIFEKINKVQKTVNWVSFKGEMKDKFFLKLRKELAGSSVKL